MMLLIACCLKIICCIYGSKWKCNEFLQAVAITQFKYHITIVLLFIIGTSFLNSFTVHFSLSACLLVASSRMDSSQSLAHMPWIVASRPHWSPNDKSDLVEPRVTFINESGWSAVISIPSAMNDIIKLKHNIWTWFQFASGESSLLLNSCMLIKTSIDR